MTQAALNDFATAEKTTEETADTTLPFDYTDIQTHDDLIEWSKAYAKIAAEEYEMDVDFDLIVGWDVSTQAKRRAAGFGSHSKALKEKMGARIGIPMNWDAARDELNDKIKYDDIRHGTLSLTWGAFEEFSEEEWKETIRHELIHAEEFQEYGVSDHRDHFKLKAEEYDTSNKCKKFTDYKYELYCNGCEEMVGGRYRKSKLVKNPGEYLTPCCNRTFRVEEA